jgi:hypothetical protein
LRHGQEAARGEQNQIADALRRAQIIAAQSSDEAIPQTSKVLRVAW